MACHECRFCCTLPMCTYPPGHKDNTIFDIEQKEEVKNQKNIVTADEIFFSDQHVYRSDNYYCLKPYSHENPRKWRRYEVAGFRQSFNKEMLENTTTFKFDKYLYNFVDPKIFNTFTKNDRKASKIWKKSYQWRYMRRVPGDESSSYVSSNGSWTNITKCVKKCIQMEKSAFAKKCEKGGGFFKCCVTRWRMHEFEEIRNQLIQDGLINDKSTNICDKKSTKDRCLFCRANGICTKQNPSDGSKTHFFYPKHKKETKSKLDAATAKLRFMWCYVLDLCKYHTTRMYHDNKRYHNAMTKEEVCAAASHGNFGGNGTLVKDGDRCKRMVTGNIIKCSQEDEKGLDEKIITENKMLLRLIKKKKKTRKTRKKQDTTEEKIWRSNPYKEKTESYLAEQFRQISQYLAKQFGQITDYFGEHE